MGLGLVLTPILDLCFATEIKAQQSSTHFGVVCGVLACDEVLTAFLDAGLSQESVIALSYFADDKRYSNVSEKWRQAIKPRFGLQLEKIITLKPDLVVLSSYSRSDYQEILKKAGIKILFLDAATTIQDIQANILKLGEAIGRKDLGERIVAKMKKESDDMKAQCRPQTKPKAILQFYPENGSVSGTNGTITEIIKLACAKNYASTLKITGWPKLALERHMTLKPDYLLIASGIETPEALYANLQKHDQWSKIPAIKQGRLIFVDDRYLSSQSHHILKAVQFLKDELKKKESRSAE